MAAAIAQSPKREAKVIVHAMNAMGAQKIQALLPQAYLVPLSRITKDNATFKRLRIALANGPDVDWISLFKVEKL